MLESLFNKVLDLKICIFIKKTLQHTCFLVKFTKHLKTPFLQNTSGGYLWRSNLTSHSILHYLWSADLPKSLSLLIVSLSIFSQYFFQKSLPGGKKWGYPTLLISWFINVYVVNVFRVQHRPILSECSVSIPPENVRRPLFSRSLKMEYWLEMGSRHNSDKYHHLRAFFINFETFYFRMSLFMRLNIKACDYMFKVRKKTFN